MKASDGRGRTTVRWGAGGEPHARVPEWVLDAEVSDRAIRLYCLLGRYADAAGHGFPGKPKLMKRLAGISRSTLDAAIVELVEIGALTVEPRFREDGGRSSNDYLLAWAPPTDRSGRGTSDGSEGGGLPVGGGPLDGSEGLTRGRQRGLNESQLNEEAIASRDDLSMRGIGPWTHEEIFDHWRRVRDKPRAKLTEGRRTKIRARLKSFAVDELKRAIDGVANDPWKDRANHDELTIIFRNDEQVERFLAFADRGPSREGGLSGGEAARVAREVASR